MQSKYIALSIVNSQGVVEVMVKEHAEMEELSHIESCKLEMRVGEGAT